MVIHVYLLHLLSDRVRSCEINKRDSCPVPTPHGQFICNQFGVREAACSDRLNVAVFDRMPQSLLNPFSLICWSLHLVPNPPEVVLRRQNIKMDGKIAYCTDVEAVKDQ